MPRVFAKATGVLLFAAMFALLSVAPRHAAAETPGVGVRGLPAAVQVTMPVPAADKLVVSGSVGYGYLDPLPGQAAAGRALGSLALVFSPIPEFSLGADISGRRDAFSDGANSYGEPRAVARFATGVSETQFLGAQLDVRLVGAEAPSVQWSATSPALRAQYGARAARYTWLAIELGFELDHSSAAVPDWTRIAVTDERTLSASSWYGVPVGLGVSHSVSPEWQVMADASGEWLVGDSSPEVLQAPWRVSGGVRYHATRSLTLQAGVDVALSIRGSVPAAQTLPREPRVTGFLGLAWALPREVPRAPVRVRPAPQPKPRVIAPPPVEAPKPEPTTPVTGSLVDEGGRPMADAEVVLLHNGAEVGRNRTTAEGQFEFEHVLLGAIVLRVEETGYERVEVTIGADQPRSLELVLRPAVPAGQVRGKVLDLNGNPIMAVVTVNPGELSLTAATDGSFELDLTPGRYTVRFEHPNFAPQRRTIVVKDRGVVILNLGLVR